MTILLADLKEHCRVTTDADDALLQGKIDAAAAWIAGYTCIPADADDIPANVLEATRILAGHLYDFDVATPGATVQSIPQTALDLLEPYRAWSF